MSDISPEDQKILDLTETILGVAVPLVVRPILAVGGTITQVIFLLESIIVSVMIACFHLGADEHIIDIVAERAKKRLAEIRLTDIETGGSA